MAPSVDLSAADPSAAIRSLLTAIDAADADTVTSLVAPDVMFAVPRPDDIETAERLVVRGSAAVAGHVGSRDGGVHHRIANCLADERVALVEGFLVDPANGADVGSFMSSATFGGDGRIVRYLHFAGRPATAAAAPGGDPDVDAAELIDRYFHHLETGHFEAAVDCFSHDVVYAHPPYRHTGIDSQERVVFRGRSQLLAAFRARGVQSFRHRISTLLQHDAVCLFEGQVVDLPVGGPGAFTSSATLGTDGRISRYVSFYCEPAPGG